MNSEDLLEELWASNAAELSSFLSTALYIPALAKRPMLPVDDLNALAASRATVKPVKGNVATILGWEFKPLDSLATQAKWISHVARQLHIVLWRVELKHVLAASEYVYSASISNTDEPRHVARLVPTIRMDKLYYFPEAALLALTFYEVNKISSRIERFKGLLPALEMLSQGYKEKT